MKTIFIKDQFLDDKFFPDKNDFENKIRLL